MGISRQNLNYILKLLRKFVVKNFKKITDTNIEL
ncbi:MAG: hypothetical protein HWN66_09080 [Candidatus Helarchaeota archaeon]|nr:hypothetical protein [Candidatus Helarchaeota archaeon]